nr:uncharacterized protein LOC113726870 [Coffea arabica]
MAMGRGWGPSPRCQITSPVPRPLPPTPGPVSPAGKEIEVEDFVYQSAFRHFVVKGRLVCDASFTCRRLSCQISGYWSRDGSAQAGSRSVQLRSIWTLELAGEIAALERLDTNDLNMLRERRFALVVETMCRCAARQCGQQPCN